METPEEIFSKLDDIILNGQRYYYKQRPDGKGIMEADSPHDATIITSQKIDVVAYNEVMYDISEHWNE